MKRVSDTQRTVINEFKDRFGGVVIIQHKNTLQLLLNTKMVQTEGIGIEWLLKFNEVFNDVSIGIQQDPSPEYSMYIQLKL